MQGNKKYSTQKQITAGKAGYLLRRGKFEAKPKSVSFERVKTDWKVGTLLLSYSRFMFSTPLLYTGS